MYDNEAMDEKLERVLTSKVSEYAGKTALLRGWVDIRRDHGKLIFFDLRDKDGLVQVVVNPKVSEEAYEAAQSIRPEYVVEVVGAVNKRPEGNVNKDLISGTVEIEAHTVSVLNTSETPPIDVTTEGSEIGEDLRLKYRYLDLRRPRMQKNLRVRHKVIKEIRDFLDKEEFIEVETPVLTKSTPEGARDYVVPSRLDLGKFYALPQSPQQYKQLLMVAGVEKYFQIARCFRDEDTRSDRQPEFTQLDLEASFVKREDVMELNEKLLIHLVKTLFPNKKIQDNPFPRISYKEAMEKYGSDRPDLRKDKNDPDLLAFCWVIDFPFFEKTEEGGWTFTHNPFSSPKEEHMKYLMEKENIGDILTTQYDIVLNGFEIGGGSIRNHKADALKKVFEVMGYEEKTIEQNFGHMLKALSYGAPPHGGIAWGLDRFITILQNESTIREVIAFAKTGEGRDLMMESPSQISDKQLRELNLKIGK
jgi:aspartyl-tRNA synthetase